MPQDTHQPPQHQDRRPGLQSEMDPQPRTSSPSYRGSGKLADKVVLITGGDSGIGRAVAVLCAREGATVGFAYLDEDADAAETVRLVEEEGRPCRSLRGDVGDPATCARIVDDMVAAYGRIDVLINNAAEQHPQADLSDITPAQLERTFRTNVFAMFHLTAAALPHLRAGSAIVNTSSVTAYRGSAQLLDYSATKGAIVSFTRSLSQNLASRGIRVNAVAPGPIWTPLIPSTFPEERVERFGADVPMSRAGQPDEAATCFVFLASDDASYMTGQVLHPNGGSVING